MFYWVQLHGRLETGQLLAIMDTETDLGDRLRRHRRGQAQGALSRPAFEQAMQAGRQQRMADTASREGGAR